MANPNQRVQTDYPVITDPLAALRQANEAESWEWLTVNQPAHAYAIELAVRAGASPEQIYQTVLRDTQRQEFARRCLLAARHLKGSE